MAKEITNNGFVPTENPIAGGRANNTDTTPDVESQSLFDSLFGESAQNALFTDANSLGIYNRDGNDFANQFSETQNDWTAYWDRLGLTANQRYNDALQRQQNAKTAAEKEKWANIAAQLQTEMMRDSDRAYNSATSQVERLMAAGMSRQAAMAAVQGVASEGQAAGVANDAPTKRQEFINQAEQAINTTSSLVSTALTGVNMVQAIKAFPYALESAKSMAEYNQAVAFMAKREQEGADASDAFLAAGFDAFNRFTYLHETNPEAYPEAPKRPHSVKEVKDLINKAADARISGACVSYRENWQSILEGNGSGQARVQHAFTGWAGEGKAYHPDETAWSFLDNQVKYNAMTTQQNYFNACTNGRKMQSEIELNNEDCKTAGYMRAKLSAETGLAVTQTQGQEIANKLAELEYEVRTDYTAYECAYYAGQTEILLNAYDMGYKSSEATRIANDANYQGWVASQRYQYILDPTGYEQANAGSPWLLRLVQDKAGTLGAMTSYYNMQTAEGASEVSQYTGEHAAGVVGLGMLNDNLKAIGTLFGGYGVANNALRFGQYSVGFNQSVSQGAQPYNYQTNGITLPSANYQYQ